MTCTCIHVDRGPEGRFDTRTDDAGATFCNLCGERVLPTLYVYELLCASTVWLKVRIPATSLEQAEGIFNHMAAAKLFDIQPPDAPSGVIIDDVTTDDDVWDVSNASQPQTFSLKKLESFLGKPIDTWVDK